MIRCRDCDGPMKGCQTRFCRACFLRYHSVANQHHIPEMFLGETWRRVSLTDSSFSLASTLVTKIQRALPAHCSTGCSKAPSKHLCVIYYLNPPRPNSCFVLEYLSCTCHRADNLIGLGVMPLSPSKPSVGVTLDTMHTLFQVLSVRVCLE